MDEWNERVLCPDESCIGTIGEDGRCRICGVQFVIGTIPESVQFSDGVPEIPSQENNVPENATPEENSDRDIGDPGQIEGPADVEWESRILCPDEGCIGVIGPDGKCKVCGRTADSPGASSSK